MKASSISTEPGQWRGETVNWRKEVIKYCGRSDPIFFLRFSLVICCIHFVVQSLSGVQLFSTPWTAAHQASLSFTISQSLLKLMSIESVMPSNLLILCRPLLLLPSLFPSIRVFSNESVLRIRCPNFGVSVSASGEGNGNPLQYSCLENPMDGGAWWAAVYGVTQSRTRLK